jgi:hypothetical protein
MAKRMECQNTIYMEFMLFYLTDLEIRDVRLRLAIVNAKSEWEIKSGLILFIHYRINNLLVVWRCFHQRFLLNVSVQKNGAGAAHSLMFMATASI